MRFIFVWIIGMPFHVIEEIDSLLDIGVETAKIDNVDKDDEAY